MSDKKKMILDWMRKVHQLEYAHCYQSIYYASLEKRIGIWAFILSTFIAFYYRFPNIDNDFFNTYLFFLKKDYLMPFLAFIVALLTAAQTFLKPSEKAEIHKKIGFDYEKLRHFIETVITNEYNDSILDEKIMNIKKRWDELNSVYVEERFFTKGKLKVKSFNKYRKELDFLPDIN